MTIVTWTGDPEGVLDHFPDTFRPLSQSPHSKGARLLINFTPVAEAAIDAATEFAAADPGDGPAQDRLIVTVLHPHPATDWPGVRGASVIWAFTRHAARAWAGRLIRVNAIGLVAGADSVPPADIAACILAMWRWRSMTGQVIRLGE